MFTHLLAQEELKKGDGPIALILTPTRELAHQVYVEVKKFGKPLGVSVCALYGGVSKTDQFRVLKSGVPPDVIVATPGRLIDLIKMKGTNLLRVTYLVLDEVSRTGIWDFIRILFLLSFKLSILLIHSVIVFYFIVHSVSSEGLLILKTFLCS
jgi:superfamily II DNA/RNA helicase